MRTILLFLTITLFKSIEAQYQAIYTIAGNATAGYSGDLGRATSAQLNSPEGIAIDASGNQFIADNENNCIRKVTGNTGLISTIAGNGTAGFSGDGGQATSAQLNHPTGIALDASGNIYIADYRNYRVRKIDSGTGIITTIAGSGKFGHSGDGGQATLAELSVTGIALDAFGNIYIADYLNSRVREVNVSTGIIATIAGTGVKGYSGDSGQAVAAELYNPWSVALDNSGNVYIGDLNNYVVREIKKSSGAIYTVAGYNKSDNYSGDGGLATNATLSVYGIAVDSSNNLYISDFVNNRIRKVNASNGLINTIAGTGISGYSGNKTEATLADLNSPQGISIDGRGNVYIADFGNNVIREVPGIVLNRTINSCWGYPDTITASGFFSNYSWTPSSGLSKVNFSQVIATPSVTTTYTVTGKSGSLTDSTFYTVWVYNNSDSLSFSDIQSCGDSLISVTVNGANTYLWSPGNLTGSDVLISPSATTTYTIVGTDNNGCVITATKTYTINSIFTEITQQPVDQTALVNSNVLIYLIARGTNTYQWQQNDGLGFVNLYNAGPFSGVNTDSLTVSELTTVFNNSLFRCIITNGTCIDTSKTILLTVKNVSGIENFNVNDHVLVFPNPSFGEFTIQTNNCKEKILNIVDMTGKLMTSVTFISSSKVIYANSLPDGVYDVSLTTTGGESVNKRLVIVR